MSNISGSCECETQQHTLKDNENLMKLLRSTPTVNMLGALYQIVTYTPAHTHTYTYISTQKNENTMNMYIEYICRME
jgi:hypothetical protein